MSEHPDLAIALRASDRAAALALRRFEVGVETSKKADGSPVSEADRAVERLLRREIAAAAPGDAFLGEELGRAGTSDRVWILDPIDGTSCFSRRDPHWRVHVALEVTGRIEVAVVTAPALRRQWWASRGGGAFASSWPPAGAETQLAVSSTTSLAESRLDAVDDASRARLPPRAAVTSQRTEGWCAGLIGLLDGEVDGFLADRFQVWDHAPWTLLVEEAGGRFTGGHGGSGAEHGGGGLYTNGRIHDELLAVLPPAAAWIDERLVIRDSPIEGRGLFFAEGLATGTVVLRLGGRLVSSPELDAMVRRADADPDIPYVDTVAVYEDMHLVLPPDSPIHFGNHSCDPTLWPVGPYEVATRRDVVAGEEATIDYGTVSGADGFRMACRCGIATCRGEVTSADWRRAELQQRYRDHWVPALQQRIDRT